MRYRAVFSDSSVLFFTSLTRRQQVKLLDRAQSLAGSPFVVPDFRSKDDDGREICHLLIDDYLFEYWVDDAARLVMIVDIEDAE